VNDKNAFYKAIVGFFDQQALASYRNEPDKYTLKTDHFEGRLEKSDTNQSSDRLDIRFGYRTRTNGDLALAVFLPDLKAASPNHQARWLGFHLQDSELADAPDPRFEMWQARYLEGSWEVDNGPLYYIENTIELINALCSEVVGNPLFKHATNPTLNFPAAQNTHAYQDAHRELYGYIIDGLDKDTISLIGAHAGACLNLNNDNTLKAIKRVLPTLVNSDFERALEKISRERRPAGHGVRSAARPFQAFEQFTSDLEALVRGLKELLKVLETALGMNGEIARLPNYQSLKVKQSKALNLVFVSQLSKSTKARQSFYISPTAQAWALIQVQMLAILRLSMKIFRQKTSM